MLTIEGGGGGGPVTAPPSFLLGSPPPPWDDESQAATMNQKSDPGPLFSGGGIRHIPQHSFLSLSFVSISDWNHEVFEFAVLANYVSIMNLLHFFFFFFFFMGWMLDTVYFC